MITKDPRHIGTMIENQIHDFKSDIRGRGEKSVWKLNEALTSIRSDIRNFWLKNSTHQADRSSAETQSELHSAVKGGCHFCGRFVDAVLCKESRYVIGSSSSRDKMPLPSARVRFFSTSFLPPWNKDPSNGNETNEKKKKNEMKKKEFLPSGYPRIVFKGIPLFAFIDPTVPRIRGGDGSPSVVRWKSLSHKSW